MQYIHQENVVASQSHTIDPGSSGAAILPTSKSTGNSTIELSEKRKQCLRKMSNTTDSNMKEVQNSYCKILPRVAGTCQMSTKQNLGSKNKRANGRSNHLKTSKSTIKPIFGHASVMKMIELNGPFPVVYVGPSNMSDMQQFRMDENKCNSLTVDNLTPNLEDDSNICDADIQQFGENQLNTSHSYSGGNNVELGNFKNPINTVDDCNNLPNNVTNADIPFLSAEKTINLNKDNYDINNTMNMFLNEDRNENELRYVEKSLQRTNSGQFHNLPSMNDRSFYNQSSAISMVIPEIKSTLPVSMFESHMQNPSTQPLPSETDSHISKPASFQMQPSTQQVWKTFVKTSISNNGSAYSVTIPAATRAIDSRLYTVVPRINGSSDPDVCGLSSSSSINNIEATMFSAIKKIKPTTDIKPFKSSTSESDLHLSASRSLMHMKPVVISAKAQVKNINKNLISTVNNCMPTVLKPSTVPTSESNVHLPTSSSLIKTEPVVTSAEAQVKDIISTTKHASPTVLNQKKVEAEDPLACKTCGDKFLSLKFLEVHKKFCIVVQSNKRKNDEDSCNEEPSSKNRKTSNDQDQASNFTTKPVISPAVAAAVTNIESKVTQSSKNTSSQRRKGVLVKFEDGVQLWIDKLRDLLYLDDEPVKSWSLKRGTEVAAKYSDGLFYDAVVMSSYNDPSVDSATDKRVSSTSTPQYEASNSPPSIDSAIQPAASSSVMYVSKPVAVKHQNAATSVKPNWDPEEFDWKVMPVAPDSTTKPIEIDFESPKQCRKPKVVGATALAPNKSSRFTPIKANFLNKRKSRVKDNKQNTVNVKKSKLKTTSNSLLRVNIQKLRLNGDDQLPWGTKLLEGKNSSKVSREKRNKKSEKTKCPVCFLVFATAKLFETHKRTVCGSDGLSVPDFEMEDDDVEVDESETSPLVKNYLSKLTEDSDRMSLIPRGPDGRRCFRRGTRILHRWQTESGSKWYNGKILRLLETSKAAKCEFEVEYTDDDHDSGPYAVTLYEDYPHDIRIVTR